MIKKIIRTVIGIVLIYGAVAFAMKAGLGVLPVDAAIASIADVLNVKVGTISILFHGSFFLGQIAMERKNFKKTEFFQVLYITLGGTVLNFFLYTVLKNVTFGFYPIRLLVTLAAFLTAAFGCTAAAAAAAGAENHGCCKQKAYHGAEKGFLFHLRTPFLKDRRAAACRPRLTV